MRAAVIGGGVIGCSVALALADRDVAVELIEARATLFSGTSRAGFGSLTPYSDPFFRDAARDFAAHSVALYRDSWLPRVAREAEIAVDVGDKGLLDLLVDDDAVREAELLQTSLHVAGYRAELFGRDAVLRMEPALQGNYLGALWLDEPWIDREQYFMALEVCLRRSACVDISVNSTALEIEDQGSGGVFVLLADGRRVQADFVIVCTGLYSRQLLGISLPKLTWLRGDAMTVTAPDGRQLIERHVYKQSAFVTPRRDGRLLLGATYVTEIVDPHALEAQRRDRITAGQALHLLHVNSELVPAILGFDIVQAWRGWRPTPADGLPVLGLTDHPQVMAATGFIGLGITMAPAVAEAVASCVCDGDTNDIPLEFSPSRSAPRGPAKSGEAEQGEWVGEVVAGPAQVFGGVGVTRSADRCEGEVAE